MTGKQWYAAYLQSDHWKALRKKKKKYARRGCLGCLRRSHLHLHHMIYRNSPELTKVSDLVWLCPRCHKLFHEKHGRSLRFSADNPKVMIKETRAKLRKILRKLGIKIEVSEEIAYSNSAPFSDNPFPSPDEIARCSTGNEGWTRAQLQVWGVAWPPPKGWKAELEQRWISFRNQEEMSAYEYALERD